MRYFLFSLVVVIAGCSSSSGPSNGNGSNTSTSSNFGKLTGHTAVTDVSSGDSIIAGATVTLIPLNRTTVSNANGVFTFDSVPPGKYELFVQQNNLCYDTLRDNQGAIFLEVDSGRTTNYDALVNTILSDWDATIGLGGGDYIEGPLTFYAAPYVSMAYDGVDPIFGTWSLTGNALTMTIPGPAGGNWKYTGTFSENQSSQTLSGQVFDGSALDSWSAKRY